MHDHLLQLPAEELPNAVGKLNIHLISGGQTRMTVAALINIAEVQCILHQCIEYMCKSDETQVSKEILQSLRGLLSKASEHENDQIR